MEDFDSRDVLFDNGDIVQTTPPPVHHNNLGADLVKLHTLQIMMTMRTTLREAAVSQVAEKLPSRALPPPSFPRQVRVGIFIADRYQKVQKQKGDYFLLQLLLEIELKADDAHCAQPKKGTLTQRRWSTPSSRTERARRSSSRTSSSCPARRWCCKVSIGQKENDK